MRYNADITHCSGYLCPLAEKCCRFRLYEAWDKMNPKPHASFIHAMYDSEKDKCAMFRPIRTYES